MVTLKDILEYNDEKIAKLVQSYFPNNEKIEKSKEFEFFKQANENNIELLSQKLNEDLDEERIDRNWDEYQLYKFEMIKENYQNSFIEKTKKVFAKNIRSLKILIKNKDSLDEINNDEIIFYLLNYESYHDNFIKGLLYELNKENLIKKFIEILIKKDQKIIEKILTPKDFNSFLNDILERKDDIVNYVKEYELKIENPSSVGNKDCNKFTLVNSNKEEFPKKLIPQ